MENMQTQITGILELNKPQTEEKQQTQITDGLEEESKNPKRKFDEKDISKVTNTKTKTKTKNKKKNKKSRKKSKKNSKRRKKKMTIMRNQSLL